MSQKEHEVAGIMAKDVEDERRLRKYAMKYETIVKQFDELKGIATDNTTMKWRKRSRGGASGGNAGATSRLKGESNEALLKTVTRFLHEL
ncbi:hypothetical protein SESBI_32916 [Sesbania bispinosa]|nr:hypothetical protein SESBI_32916 [Sesbania bispinosa]